MEVDFFPGFDRAAVGVHQRAREALQGVGGERRQRRRGGRRRGVHHAVVKV